MARHYIITIFLSFCGFLAASQPPTARKGNDGGIKSRGNLIEFNLGTASFADNSPIYNDHHDYSNFGSQFKTVIPPSWPRALLAELGLLVTNMGLSYTRYSQNQHAAQISYRAFNAYHYIPTDIPLNPKYPMHKGDVVYRQANCFYFSWLYPVYDFGHLLVHLKGGATYRHGGESIFIRQYYLEMRTTLNLYRDFGLFIGPRIEKRLGKRFSAMAEVCYSRFLYLQTKGYPSDSPYDFNRGGKPKHVHL